MRMRRVTLGAAVTAGVLVLAGCGGATGTPGSQQGSAPRAAPAAPRAASDPLALQTCADGKSQVASFAPQESKEWYLANDDTIKRIKAAGRLIAGTSGDVRLWGARNPESGQLEGFDIELLNKIATAIGVPLTTKVINYGDRIPDLQSTVAGTRVDIVAHTMTINCDRWSQINFSSEYYRAGQRVLVRRDPLAGGGKGAPLATSVAGLKGQKVCVATGSTNIGNIKTISDAQKLNLQTVEAADLGDCLVKFQRGEVDAITGDDTVLAGFASQDQTYSVVTGDQFSTEPYGLGFNRADPGFTEFVNILLQEWRSDGSLNAMAKKWMTTAAEPIPPAVYGRTGNATKVS